MPSTSPQRAPIIRKLHRLSTWLVGLQLLVWVGTGFAFTCFDFRAVRGTLDKGPAPVLDARQAAVPVAQVLSQLGARHATGVELRPLLGEGIYVVSTSKGPTQVFRAKDGRPRPALTREEATTVARGQFAGPAEVESCALVQDARDAVDLPLPVFRVRFRDALATDVFISPTTGEVLAWRNRRYRVFDALWSLHVLGYVSRDNPAHPTLRLLAGLACLVVASGAALLFLGLRAGGRPPKAP